MNINTAAAIEGARVEALRGSTSNACLLLFNRLKLCPDANKAAELSKQLNEVVEKAKEDIDNLFEKFIENEN